jgi:hypothetical protein
MNTAPVIERQDKDLVSGEYVAAELNLESIGYFSAGYKRKYPNESQRSKIVLLNHDRRIEIIPNLKYGFPNSEDQDFYRAFLKICDENVTLIPRRRDGQLTLHPQLRLPIAFHSREIIRKAGRMWSNRDLQSVRDWIKRSTSTVIEGEIYRAKTKGFRRFGGPLFSQHILVGERMRGGKVADMNLVWPAPWFLSNFYYRYVRPIDLLFHQRLRKPIAKTLYPILDTGWYAADGKEYAKRYDDLCALLFIPAHLHLSLIKQQLDPSHEELQREKFLASWEYSESATGEGGGVIRWWPGPKWFQDQEVRMSREDLIERYGDAVALPPPTAVTSTSSEVTRVEVPVDSMTDVQDESAKHAERVRAFYIGIGQRRISRQKVNMGISVLTDLQAQGFTVQEIDVGLQWITAHQKDLGGTIYSLSLLPEVIGQALAAGGPRQRQKRKEEKQQESQQSGLDDFRKMQEAYGTLSTAEQNNVRERAIQRLTSQGVKKEFLLEGLIKNEVHQLLREQGS